MATYRILSWRGIPAQLKVADDGGRPTSVALPEWFVQEIDRVAMREGIVGSDEYLELWEWGEQLERPGSAADVAAALVDEIEAEWEPARKRRPRPDLET
jgi:hypothetical protein